MVSVIIPVYNRPVLLERALQSVFGQRYQNFEIIVVDDGSQPPVQQSAGEDSGILQQLLEDPRVTVLRIPHCGMAGAVRNRGAAIARGRYLAFLDSDDLWLPDKLALQVKLLDAQEGIPLVHTREVWLRKEKVLSQAKQNHQKRGDIFSDALVKCIIGPSTVLLRSSSFHHLEGFREDLEVAEDYELWLRYTALHSVAYIETPQIVKFAGHGSQLSSKYDQIEGFRIAALSSLVEQQWFNSKQLPEKQLLAEKALIHKWRIFAAGA